MVLRSRVRVWYAAMRGLGWATFLCAMLFVGPARAWVIAEHTRITSLAIEEVRTKHPEEARFLAESAEALGLCVPSPPKTCNVLQLVLDVLPAIAADHSCTPNQLATYLDDALKGRTSGAWLYRVLAVGEATGRKLKELESRHYTSDRNRIEERVEERRRTNINLQLVDRDYANRTVLDWSHFQEARPAGPIDLASYLAFALSPSRNANATAAYANYHVVAMRLAAKLHTVNQFERGALQKRMLLAEIFAIHFLEDAFAAGHFVGHWGDDATRLGTHDYYAPGVEAQRWTGMKTNAAPYTAHGDAFLSEDEAALAGAAAAKSLHQVLSIAVDAHEAEKIEELTGHTYGFEAHDSCTDTKVAPDLDRLATQGIVREVLEEEPIPFERYPGKQRYRAENGLFVGVSAGGDVGIGSVFAQEGGERGVLSRFRAAIRFGYGAGGLTHDPLNSLAFIDAGLIAAFVDATSTDGPSVTGWSLRARAPGVVTLVEGGLIIVLAQATRDPALIQAGAYVTNGGLGGLWKSHQFYGPVYWQLALFRDVTFNRYPSHSYRPESRHELLGPLFTFRSAIPISGDGIAQSTDAYLDFGPTITWRSRHDNPATTSSPIDYAHGPIFGAYVSFSASTRVFP